MHRVQNCIWGPGACIHVHEHVHVYTCIYKYILHLKGTAQYIRNYMYMYIYIYYKSVALASIRSFVVVCTVLTYMYVY